MLYLVADKFREIHENKCLTLVAREKRIGWEGEKSLFSPSLHCDPGLQNKGIKSKNEVLNIKSFLHHLY